MKKIVLSIVYLFFVFSFMNAQNSIKIWVEDSVLKNDSTAPGKTLPELFIYLPEAAVNTGKAVVICPGGGYKHLAMDHEGHDVAKWLTKQGIAGIVLKYRMPEGRKDVPLQDAQRAMQLVHENAVKWNIDKTKIGIAGFSAGGHLASTASTHFISTETRPTFSILFYPVISMDEAITHAGSKNNLLEEKPSVSDTNIFSNEKQVNASTPPTILLLSDDDKSVLPENSVRYYDALKQNNIKASMYIFPVGGHGWGMRESFKYHNEMLSLLKSWLDSI